MIFPKAILILMAALMPGVLSQLRLRQCPVPPNIADVLRDDFEHNLTAYEKEQYKRCLTFLEKPRRPVLPGEYMFGKVKDPETYCQWNIEDLRQWRNKS